VHIDHSQARAALAATSQRTADLLRSVADGQAKAKGSEWTIGEVGAHMAVTLLGFTFAAQGQPEMVEPYIPQTDRFPDRLSRVTANTLAIEPERDPPALARLVPERTDGFLSATVNRSGSERLPTPWYGDGVSLSLATATAMLLGEQLIHGYDIARTTKRPWPIEADHARLLMSAVTSMMPLAVNPEKAVGEATYDIRVRGGPRFFVHVGKGAVKIESSTAGAVDCHISADPVALALVAYGRLSQWGPVAKGKLFAWGRRPWLALRFKALFFNP
jgi:uncharacterized protein (TIGR03083 family)